MKWFRWDCCEKYREDKIVLLIEDLLKTQEKLIKFIEEEKKNN